MNFHVQNAHCTGLSWWSKLRVHSERYGECSGVSCGSKLKGHSKRNG